MRRVVVVGAWGAGKSRFAATLATALAAPLIEHDRLYWAEGWHARPTAEFRALAASAAAADAWVADGNFSAARDVVWGRADTLVWLDYSLPLVWRRLAWRQLRRWITRETRSAGSRYVETLAGALGPRSLLWAMPARHAAWRREYPALLASPQYSHLHTHRLHTPSEADRWLAQWLPTITTGCGSSPTSSQRSSTR